MRAIRRLLGLAAFSFLLANTGHASVKDRITILYDAFSDDQAVTKDWGFSALVEHDGKRILFDTGNNAAMFEHNVKALGVSLSKLDFVVISHRHSDHATGLKIPSLHKSEGSHFCSGGTVWHLRRHCFTHIN